MDSIVVFQEFKLISLKCGKGIFYTKAFYEEGKGHKMRYTFQDSTDFPVQKDFIQDLQDFIVISKEVIPLEKSAIEIKNESKEKTVSLDRRLAEIDRFENDVRSYIENRTVGVDENDILDIKAKILETSSTVSMAKKNEEIEALNRQNKLDLLEVQQLEERILSILSPFFETSIYGARDTYYAFIEDKILKGKQVSFVDGMQYEFELGFPQNMLKVKDLQVLALPIWTKSGILSREIKVKKIDVSDFYITSIEYEGNNLKAVLEDKDPENRFIISVDEKTFLILHKDYEITGDKDLAASLNRDSVVMFIIKLKELFTEYAVSKKLRRIILDGKNVIDENRIFDCLKLIASIYGQLVDECVKRGYSDGEITIKIEEPEGIRTEKYIDKSEISRELSTIGSEGKELAKELRVIDI
jgi:hypothetical protein